jgi:hypothetical protein
MAVVFRCGGERNPAKRDHVIPVHLVIQTFGFYGIDSRRCRPASGLTLRNTFGFCGTDDGAEWNRCGTVVEPKQKRPVNLSANRA